MLFLDSSVFKTTGALANKKANLKSTAFDYKELLRQSFTDKSVHDSFDQNFIRTLPTPKELKVNQSVDDILKKYSYTESESFCFVSIVT